MSMSSPQLTELEAFWIVEGGWGDYKQDYRFGQLCALHANINRDTKKRQHPYSAAEFALRPREPQDPKNTARKIKFALRGLTGKRKKKNG